MRTSKKSVPWLFLTPALFIYTFVVMIPIFCSLGFSFFEYNGVSAMKFIGLSNYSYMLRDRIFIQSVKNNLFFMVVSTTLQMITGLAFAIILSNLRKGANVIRVIYFIPCIISSSAICQIFQKMFSLFPEGVFAALMKAARMQPVPFLSDPKLTLSVVTILDAYKNVGIYMIIFYAALKDIDDQVVEAAAIDGCGWWQLHTKIKIPMIMNIVVMACVLLVNGTLKGFDISYILTGGGPGTSSELVSTYMYKTAFRAARFGLSSAMGVFLVLESLLAVYLVQKAGKRFQMD